MTGNGGPKNFSDALNDLEDSAKATAGDYQARLLSELKNIEEKLKNLRPHLDDLGAKTKKAVEDKAQENPWAVIGIAGALFFILGWLIGYRNTGRRD